MVMGPPLKSSDYGETKTVFLLEISSENKDSAYFIGCSEIIAF